MNRSQSYNNACTAVPQDGFSCGCASKQSNHIKTQLLSILSTLTESKKQKKSDEFSVSIFMAYRKPILAFTLACAMMVLHFYGFFHGFNWWVCSGICSAAMAYCAWDVMPQWKELLTWLPYVTLGIIAVLNPWIGLLHGLNTYIRWIVVVYAMLMTIRAMFGGAHEVLQNPSKSLNGLNRHLRVSAFYATLFSVLALVYHFHPGIAIGWFGFIGVVFLYDVFSLHERAVEFKTSMTLMLWVTWVFSTAVVIWPGLHHLGIHVMYHDALFTLAAWTFGNEIKSKQQRISDQEIRMKSRVIVWDQSDGAIILDAQNLKKGMHIILRKDQYVTSKVKIIHQTQDVRYNINDEVQHTKLKNDILSPYHHLGSGSVIGQVLEDGQPFQKGDASDDHLLKWFVPTIIVIALFVGGVHGWLGSTALAIRGFLSILMVACPCVYIIARPLVLAVAKHQWAKRGVIVHQDSILTSNTEADVYVFDRTGTIVDANSYQTRKEMTALIKQLKQSGKEVYVLSGHKNDARKDALCSTLGLDDDCIFMDSQFNVPSGENSECALYRKRNFIQSLQFGMNVQNVKNFDTRPNGTPKKKVVMIGDGRNDEHAFRQADYSFCVGNQWVSGVQADVHILDYKKLPSFLGKDVPISSLYSIRTRVRNLLTMNTVFAALYNVAMISLAAFGWVPPWAACLFMAGSSLLMLYRGLSVHSIFGDSLRRVFTQQLGPKREGYEKYQKKQVPNNCCSAHNSCGAKKIKNN